jgi:hypothetical protein
MKRLARSTGSADSSGSGSTAASSLQEELAALQREVDIHNFTYKPVPRTDDDEDEA